jgi:hypothetical protein
MPYGFILDVPLAIELYDTVKAEVARRSGPSIEGLLFHVARPKDGGYQVIEIWESKDHFDRFNERTLTPIFAELTHAQGPLSNQIAPEDFEIRGLLIPRGGIAI